MRAPAFSVTTNAGAFPFFMNEPLNIKLNEFVIEIEGVKIAIASLKEMMTDPPARSLFNFKRVDDVIEIRRFDSVETAAKFFEV